MTREKISQKIQSNQIAKQSTREWIESLVDDIYNDFKSQICKNCEHSLPILDGFYECQKYDTGNNHISNAFDDCEIYSSKDFGCNQFEPK